MTSFLKNFGELRCKQEAYSKNEENGAGNCPVFVFMTSGQLLFHKALSPDQVNNSEQKSEKQKKNDNE